MQVGDDTVDAPRLSVTAETTHRVMKVDFAICFSGGYAGTAPEAFPNVMKIPRGAKQSIDDSQVAKPTPSMTCAGVSFVMLRFAHTRFETL